MIGLNGLVGWLVDMIHRSFFLFLYFLVDLIGSLV